MSSLFPTGYSTKFFQHCSITITSWRSGWKSNISGGRVFDFPLCFTSAAVTLSLRMWYIFSLCAEGFGLRYVSETQTKTLRLLIFSYSMSILHPYLPSILRYNIHSCLTGFLLSSILGVFGRGAGIGVSIRTNIWEKKLTSKTQVVLVTRTYVLCGESLWILAFSGSIGLMVIILDIVSLMNILILQRSLNLSPRRAFLLLHVTPAIPSHPRKFTFRLKLA